MVNRVFDIGASIVVLATITSLILPGRQTVPVINALAGGFSSAIKVGMGR